MISSKVFALGLVTVSFTSFGEVSWKECHLMKRANEQDAWTVNIQKDKTTVDGIYEVFTELQKGKEAVKSGPTLIGATPNQLVTPVSVIFRKPVEIPGHPVGGIGPEFFEAARKRAHLVLEKIEDLDGVTINCVPKKSE